MISKKFLKKLFKEMISYTIKFHSRRVQESLAVNFKWNALTAWISWHNTFLTGWYLFTFFTVAPFWCTPLVTLDFCFILLTSNTVIWASLVCTHRSKREIKDFIFHAVVLFRETFQTLVWKFLLYVPEKVFWAHIFPNFLLV